MNTLEENTLSLDSYLWKRVTGPLYRLKKIEEKIELCQEFIPAHLRVLCQAHRMFAEYHNDIYWSLSNTLKDLHLINRNFSMRDFIPKGESVSVFCLMTTPDPLDRYVTMRLGYESTVIGTGEVHDDITVHGFNTNT